MDFNNACLPEATKNFHTHASIFYCLSIALVDGKRHLSEVVFSSLVGFSLFTTSSSRVRTTGLIITKEQYRDVTLRDTVSRKRPELWSTGNWRLHHDNAPAHSSHLIDFFGEKPDFEGD